MAMAHKFTAFLVAGGLLIASCLAAQAEKRVALVIGNSAYQNAPRLPNPAKDASAMADLFRSAGFDVVSLQQDVGNLDFKRAVRKFEEAALDADVAVIFYAGHGIEIGGINYMIPVDAKLASDFDAPDEAIPLDRIIDAATSATQLRLVILDACRDNPFVSSMKMRASTRSVSAGLAKVEPITADTLIGYAAKAGSTASDGTGDHSPYTTALLHNLMLPGLDIRLAFGRVRDEVMKLTGAKQEPFVYGSLGGKTIALASAPESASATPAIDANAQARLDYEEFAKVGTKEAWDAFLTLHTSGPYAELARAQRAKLAGDTAKAAPSPQQKPDAQVSSSQILSALTPAPKPVQEMTPAAGPSSLAETGRMLQAELKRVGCYDGELSGEWNIASRRAMDAFNQRVGTTFDSRTATLDALGAVRDKLDRVCPLSCGRGFRADGDHCVAIACDPGFAIGPSGACESTRGVPRATEKSTAPPPKTQTAEPPPKVQTPEPKRQTTSRPAAPAPVARAAPSSSGQGQIACDRFGCQPVKKGCKMRTEDFKGETQQEVICN
jgi:Caspase domain